MKTVAAGTTKYYSYYYRQGDILLERIYEIPKQIMNHQHQQQQQQQTQDNYIIAHGESGNQHRMSKHVLIFENPENKEERYVQVLSQDTDLVHQEHKSIHIHQGIYKIRREREYNAFESAIRQVQEVQD